MRHIRTILVTGLAVLFGAVASAEEIELVLVKVQSASEIEGSYLRTFDGFELFTFRGQMCMVTYHPKEDSTSDTVALGATDASVCSIGKNGHIEISPSSVVASTVYFALVRWNEGEGLIRLQSIDSEPPQKLPREMLKALIYRKEIKSQPNQALLPTSTAVTPAADAPVAPTAAAADL